MTSPFPGMDPYLEKHWLDVHATLIAETRRALNERLPEDLVASMEERVAVESAADDEDEDHVYRTDARIFEPATGEARAAVAAAEGGVAAPIKLVVEVDPETERWVEVIEAGTERLVTVVEFISPGNKQGYGLKAYRRKRKEVLASGVSWVEVDLVRAGDWRALMAPHECRRGAVSTYRVTVRLPGDARSAYLYPAPLRERLPEFQVPLRGGDPVLKLDLQTLLDRTYETGRYARRLDYRNDPNPPLDPADAEWADQLLRAAKKR